MSQSHDDLPQSRNHRIVFVIAVTAICVLLYIADYALTSAIDKSASASMKQHVSIINSVIENLIAGSIAAVLLALTYRWIVDWIDPSDRVIEVPPSEITDRLLKNARSTRSYVFIGNTASFVSSSVLPILAESARTSGHPKAIKLFLIDPTDDSAVNAYVSYRARVSKGSHKVADCELAMWLPPQDKKIEMPDDVTAKILATIYVAAYVALHPGMSIAIYLRHSFTPFRADISDSEAVLTQESAAEAAVAFSARGHFYGWYQKEADAQKGQSLEFNLTASRDNLRALILAHPSDPVAELERSLDDLMHFCDHLAPLLTKTGVLSKAARLISRPKRSYR